MNFRLMKSLDALLGTPLCLVLGWPLRWLARRPDPDRPIRRLLIIKCFGLGSITLISTAIGALRRHHPGIEITFVTFEEHRALLQMMDSRMRVWTVRKSSLAGFAADSLRLAGRLPAVQFDAVLDLEFYSRYTQLLAGLTLAPLRIGFHLPFLWRRPAYSDFLSYNLTKHIVEAYRMALDVLKLNSGEPAVLPLRARPEAAGSMRAAVNPLSLGRCVGMNVNASDLSLLRRWDADGFREVARRLADGGYDILLTGSPGERPYVQHFIDGSPPDLRPRLHNLAGRLSLEELIAMMQELPLFITNDSGPFHLAFAAGCPTVSLWGPGDPACYGPISDHERHRTVYSRKPCSPCLYHYGTPPGLFCAGRADCMKAIAIEDVWREVAAILDLKGAS